MENLIIYSRVSSKSQLDNYSIDNQIESGKTVAKNNNLIPIIYNEGAESSKHEDLENRPVLQGIIEQVLKNEIQNIYVFEFSRLSRNNVLSAKLRNIFIEKNVTIYEGGGSMYNLKDPNQEFTMGILQHVSQLENNIRLKRIKNNILKGIELGRIQGKYLPYGYKRDEHRILEIDTDEAKIVEKIFKQFLSGKGCKMIANYLNAKQVETRFNKTLTEDIIINDRVKSPSSFKWTSGVVYRILTQKKYIGVVEYKQKSEEETKILEFTCKPIIDEDTFEKVQTLLKSKANKINTTKKHSYLLSKKLICGVCNRNYYGRKRTNNKDNYYTCISTRYSIPCGNKSFNIPILEDFTWRCLMDSETVYNLIKSNHTNDSDDYKIEELNKLIDNIQKEIKKLESAVFIIAESYADKEIDKNTFLKITKKKNNEANFLKRELKSYLKELDFIGDKRKNFSYMSTFAKKYLFTKDFETRKKFIDLIVKNITIYSVKELDKTLDDLFKNKNDKGISIFKKLHKLDNIIYCEILLKTGDKIQFVATNRSKRFYSKPNFMKFDKTNLKLEYNNPSD